MHERPDRLSMSGRLLGEIRTRWAELPSVKLNNTLQEHWDVAPDSGAVEPLPRLALRVVRTSALGRVYLLSGSAELRLRLRHT